MIRVGSLYNYIDYGKSRVDYSGLSLQEFKSYLLRAYKRFAEMQHSYFSKEILPLFHSHGLRICSYSQLPKSLQASCTEYFRHVVYPMLTPMVYDGFHSFPVLMNHVLIFAVTSEEKRRKTTQKLSFLQVPKNIPRFYEIQKDKKTTFVPVESIIYAHIQAFFKNVDIRSISLFRLTRNGDFTLEESEDVEANFLEELKIKLRNRRTGRVVRLEVEKGYDKVLFASLCARWQIGSENVMEITPPALLDLRALDQIIQSNCLSRYHARPPKSVPSLSLLGEEEKPLLELLKTKDILLHHPYNSIRLLLRLIEQAAEDPHVLSIKLTLYRVARRSRIVEALLRAAEMGKHVAVLFEVKARFDEEHNMEEALRLQKAGCYVVYGLGVLKTHAKLLLIVRKEKEGVCRYVHTSTGNYNEDTAEEYADLGLISTNTLYADDISEFFNVITGHSYPTHYKYLITAPRGMRPRLLDLIEAEVEEAKANRPASIVLKVNSLQDKEVIDALYAASAAGVAVDLIVRGVCCLRPGRKGLSENIRVRSIVGRYLEHARILYFHNQGDPKIYIGSADIMVRSFDARVESLIQIIDKKIQQELIYILQANLLDNQNSCIMQEDGSYLPCQPKENTAIYSVHDAFFSLKKEGINIPVSLLMGDNKRRGHSLSCSESVGATLELSNPLEEARTKP